MNKLSCEIVAAVYDRRRLANTFSFRGDGYRQMLLRAVWHRSLPALRRSDGHRPPLQLKLFLVALTLGLFAPINLPAQTNPTDDVGPLAKVTLHIGNASLTTQIAASSAQQERGLMFVTKLGDNDGMIFLLPKIGTATFWMKNTLIPLSVAFIDKNGVILDIHDMKPLDESITRSDSDQVAYALETNLHWFALNGIKPGDKIDPPPATLGPPVP